jgi:Leucine-rich repeat (LRR) protein
MWNNNLTGNIPAELGNTPLRYVYFGSNNLTGEIGPVIDSLPHSLESLSVRRNQLQGTIPTSIGSFLSIKNIDFGRNDIGGSIPSQFGNLGLLEQLWLDQNNFAGTLPTSIASLPNLSKC